MQAYNFLKSISHLRQHEEMIIYGNVTTIEEEEKEILLSFLKKEFQRELLNYPFEAPDFHPEAAFWAAKITYWASQFLLHRSLKEEELVPFLKAFDEKITATAILSADLTLRFLPEIIQQLKMLDIEDVLIALLEEILEEWHFSGIPYDLPVEKLNFESMMENNCVWQLYCDRVITFKKKAFLKIPKVKEAILANLGDYQEVFWKEIKLIT